MQEAKMEEAYGSATETLSDRDTDLFGADKKELFYKWNSFLGKCGSMTIRYGYPLPTSIYSVMYRRRYGCIVSPP